MYLAVQVHMYIHGCVGYLTGYIITVIEVMYMHVDNLSFLCGDMGRVTTPKTTPMLVVCSAFSRCLLSCSMAALALWVSTGQRFIPDFELGVGDLQLM